MSDSRSDRLSTDSLLERSRSPRRHVSEQFFDRMVEINREALSHHIQPAEIGDFVTWCRASKTTVWLSFQHLYLDYLTACDELSLRPASPRKLQVDWVPQGGQRRRAPNVPGVAYRSFVYEIAEPAIAEPVPIVSASKARRKASRSGTSGDPLRQAA